MSTGRKRKQSSSSSATSSAASVSTLSPLERAMRKSKHVSHSIVLWLSDAASVVALMRASRTLMDVLVASSVVRDHVRTLQLARLDRLDEERQRSERVALLQYHSLMAGARPPPPPPPFHRFPAAADGSTVGVARPPPHVLDGVLVDDDHEVDAATAATAVTAKPLLPLQPPVLLIGLPAPVRVDPAGMQMLDSRLNLSIEQQSLGEIQQWHENSGYHELTPWQLNAVFTHGSPIRIDMPRAVQKFNYFGRAFWERKNVTVTVAGALGGFVTVGDVLQAFIDNNKTMHDVEEDSGVHWQGLRVLAPGHFECRFGDSGNPH